MSDNMENDEKKYEDVIKALKGLQEVKAPANLEADLQRRINSEKFQKEEKKYFWQNIFVPAKLIPSLGLIAVAFVIFFVIESRTEEMDNPFLIEPRIREDIFEVSDYEEFEVKKEEVSKQKSLKKDEPVLESRKDANELKSLSDETVTGREKSGGPEEVFIEEDDAIEDFKISSEGFTTSIESTTTKITDKTQPTSPMVSSPESSADQGISKEELNFRQVQLTEEEQKTVNELKSQVQSLEKANKSQK